MNSDELNQAISDLENNDNVYVECWPCCGKTMPYIGWYWRNVDWDAPQGRLGVIPAGVDGITEPLVGFMQNNKWGYDEIEVSGENWQTLRALTEELVTSTTQETCDRLREFVQSLLTPGGDR